MNKLKLAIIMMGILVLGACGSKVVPEGDGSMDSTGGISEVESTGTESSQQGVSIEYGKKYDLAYFEETNYTGSHNNIYSVGIVVDGQVLGYDEVYQTSIEEVILRDPDEKSYVVVADNGDLHVYRQPTFRYNIEHENRIETNIEDSN